MFRVQDALMDAEGAREKLGARAALPGVVALGCAHQVTTRARVGLGHAAVDAWMSAGLRI